MKQVVIIIMLFMISMLSSCGCTFTDSAGTYTVSIPSSDSVEAQYTESGANATVVGGPISGSSAVQQK